MKALIMTLIIVALSIGMASAEELTWTNAQYQAIIEGEMMFSPTSSAGLHAAGLWFHPSDIEFIAGVSWAPTEWLWTATHGGVINLGDEEFGVIAEWISLSLGNKFSIFIDAESWINEDVADFWGFASADWLPQISETLNLNLGAHVETFNEFYTVGPHLGFGHGIFSVELQWHLDPVEQTHFARSIIKLAFN